jgi:hypothetical protein
MVAIIIKLLVTKIFVPSLLISVIQYRHKENTMVAREAVREGRPSRAGHGQMSATGGRAVPGWARAEAGGARGDGTPAPTSLLGSGSRPST